MTDRQLDKTKTVALVRAMAEQLAAAAESHRREPPSLDTTPLEYDAFIDYATAAQMIATAMHHLDESIPNAQKKRTEQALLLATTGLQSLGVWLMAKGCEVTPLFKGRPTKAQEPSTFRFSMTNAEGKEVVVGAWACADPNETHRIMTAALELTEATKRGEKISDREFSRLVRKENVSEEAQMAALLNDGVAVKPKVAALLKSDPPNDGVMGFLKGQEDVYNLPMGQKWNPFAHRFEPVWPATSQEEWIRRCAAKMRADQDSLSERDALESAEACAGAESDEHGADVYKWRLPEEAAVEEMSNWTDDEGDAS